MNRGIPLKVQPFNKSNVSGPLTPKGSMAIPEIGDSKMVVTASCLHLCHTITYGPQSNRENLSWPRYKPTPIYNLMNRSSMSPLFREIFCFCEMGNGIGFWALACVLDLHAIWWPIVCSFQQCGPHTRRENHGILGLLFLILVGV